MTVRLLHRSAAPGAIALLTLAATLSAVPAAHATADRIRLGSSTDVSRTNWSGPAFTMNGDGAVVPASMTRAIDAIRASTGTLDVVVLAGSASSSGSPTPECDAVMALPGVNSCTSWTVTSAADAGNAQLNADVRNAEFVYFAGGDQCRYAAWKGTPLQASVQSVVAKGGGSGGGSAGTHINSSLVYDACQGSAASPDALADPYEQAVSFTAGMFNWPNYANTINDSHFVTRDRMGRTMAFVARAIQDGLTTNGAAWGVGVEQGGGSLFIDKNGLATEYGQNAYVVLGDHQPEQAVSGRPLTFSNYKIWRLAPGSTYDFKNRPACGYYRRGVTNGVADANLYDGTPESCGTSGGSALSESEPNDSRSTANDATALTSPMTLTGSMNSPSDRDYYKVSVGSGQTATVRCTIPSAYDADLYFMDSSGSTLTRSVNSGAGVAESLSYTRTASGAGTYYVDVEAYSGSSTAPYTCTVTKN
ncbi:pre-peptidase C-terminal domain-containing protein [Streptomyces sp. NPDC059819]|uniref:pre-peptidase C-terminal domain-containing protein n=1 Tax=Streptomyces sp. NPDC059819 TaxID=3346963 RepID=UPI0036521E66